jgi:carbonic anhydrase
MPLADILKNNAEFVRRGGGAGGSRPALGRTLIITDSDPELTGLIEPALGLTPGTASLIRIAGAWGTRGGDEIFRSVAIALYMYDCREVLVVGQSRCKCCPAPRSTLRRNMARAGLLAELPDDGENLLASLRGPGSVEIAVRETVSVLRKSMVAGDIPIYGCLLDMETGALRIMQNDPGTSKPKQLSKDAETGSTDIPQIALPDLPEISLPEIPTFDFDALTQETVESQPTAESSSQARVVEGSGPVSFSDLAKMPDAFAASPKPAFIHPVSEDAIQVPKIKFRVPQGAKIQDTGMAPIEDIAAKTDITAQADIEAMRRVDSIRETSRARKKTPRPRRPRPQRATPEQPAVTPLVPLSPAQKPLGEREISFGRDEATPTPRDAHDKRPRVDLHGGYVQLGGSEFPLDPQLQSALLKIAQFLGREFSGQQRGQLIGRVRRAASAGQSVGEMLKVVIGPVLKLGKKRYAIINELLKMKEELPRQDPDIAEVLIEGILSER